MGKRSDQPSDRSFVTDTMINANVYAYLVNSNINALKDTASLLTSMIDTIKGKSSNERFKESLACQRALRKYYSGNRFEAIQDLLLLKAMSSQIADYPTLLASWMLEQEQYHLAAEYYKEALLLGKKDIEINYAFASIMDNQPEDALFVLSQLRDREDHLYSTTIELISLKDAGKIYALDEPKRLQWFLYHLSSLTPETAQRLAESFTNPIVKVYAGAALCRYYLGREELAKAQEVFASIQAIQNLNPFAERERNYTFLLLKTKEKAGAALKENIRLPLNSDKELLRDYFTGAAYAYTGDSVQACTFYMKTLKTAPYQETVIPSAVRYLSQHSRQQEVYDYLVEIVQNDPSVPMQKAYLELCLDMSLISYAESTLNGLKGRISAAEFAAYTARLQMIQNQ
jgi:tetratricopeptide (TPR) repeat protein